VTIASDTDSVRERIGFRTIETKGTDILLNGKSVFLRGVSIHEEAPFRTGPGLQPGGCPHAAGLGQGDGLQLSSGWRTTRTTRTWYAKADRLGLMVWSETPVYWTILWENPETFANASNQLAESIARDKKPGLDCAVVGGQ